LRNGDILSGAVLAALGVFFIVEGQDLGLGRISNPGSGFMIFWVGWILTAMASAIVVAALRRSDNSTLRALWAGANWRKVGYVVLIMAIYAWALPGLGFIAATLVLLLVLFKTVEPQSWRVALIGSAASTAAAWLLFAKALGTQLPAGAFGLG